MSLSGGITKIRNEKTGPNVLNGIYEAVAALPYIGSTSTLNYLLPEKTYQKTRTEKGYTLYQSHKYRVYANGNVDIYFEARAVASEEITVNTWDFRDFFNLFTGVGYGTVLMDTGKKTLERMENGEVMHPSKTIRAGRTVYFYGLFSAQGLADDMTATERLTNDIRHAEYGPALKKSLVTMLEHYRDAVLIRSEGIGGNSSYETPAGYDEYVDYSYKIYTDDVVDVTLKSTATKISTSSDKPNNGFWFDEIGQYAYDDRMFPATIIREHEDDHGRTVTTRYLTTAHVGVGGVISVGQPDMPVEKGDKFYTYVRAVFKARR